jgi:hypothetical protein
MNLLAKLERKPYQGALSQMCLTTRLKVVLPFGYPSYPGLFRSKQSRHYRV